MIDTETASRRLEVALRHMADLPRGELDLVSGGVLGAAVSHRAERGRRLRLVVPSSIVAVSAAVLAAALAWPGTEGSSTTNRDHLPTHSREAGSATASSASGWSTRAPKRSVLPREIPGTQQVLQPEPLLQTPYSLGVGGTSLDQSTLYAFEVDGSPTFEVGRSVFTNAKTSASDDQQFAGYVVSAGMPSADGGPVGTFESEGDPNLADVLTFSTWPNNSMDLFMWNAFPASTAYVTYEIGGVTSAWETPVNGWVALLVPRPSAYNGPYAVWHDAPLGLLSAYNSQGTLLSQAKCPRIFGDDMVVSPN